jgi:hypothetical protein
MGRVVRACPPSAVLLVLASAGCGLIDQGLSGPADQVVVRGFTMTPRIRYGTYPCDMLGTPYVGRDAGTHDYYWPFFEKDGIAYTARGGHIDVIHLRIAADWTAYLTAECYKHLVNGDSRFSYKLAVDHSRNFVHISYPSGWASLPKAPREAVARKMALAMGPYLCFTTTTWHEILTWYGYKCIGLPVEFASAFSWEDSFSNLLGTRVAVQALRDTKHPYNEAVTIAVDEELRVLGIQPAQVAREAGRSVKGRWYTGDFAPFVDMKKRNFDIGLDDGYVTPTLVPNVPGCAECAGAEPVSYPVPTLDILEEYGFSVTVEIEPHEWEKDKILRIVNENKRVNPEVHFPTIMDHMRRQATARYGPEYDPDRDNDPHYVYQAK